MLAFRYTDACRRADKIVLESADHETSRSSTDVRLPRVACRMRQVHRYGPLWRCYAGSLDRLGRPEERRWGQFT